MAPIRVGLIGLGTEIGFFKPGAWAARAHLPAFKASPNFKIVALCNSTVKSAEASIAFHELGPDVKAYGSAEDLSADPEVDLVVVSVQVAKHYALTKPALLAGKDVFVEWPLGATLAESEELTALAKSKGVRTIVGVQARPDLFVVKIKDIVDSGRIGSILSSTMVGVIDIPLGVWPKGAEYYLDINSGGNALTIHFGHFLDSFIHVLGGFSKVQSILRTDFPTTNITDMTTGEIASPNHPKTAPDHIFVQGILESGAIASVNMRSSPAKTVDGVSFRWIISGTAGEIELILPPGGAWQMGAPGQTLRVSNAENQEIETVDVTDSSEAAFVSGVPSPGTNTARVYEAFFDGKTDRYATFESSLKTHQLLEEILTGSL